jgi:HD-GYP domain-containing protein (c-di-GMP phosphodiesterase class II)
MTAIAECESELGVLIPIALGTLCASSMLGFDLYMHSEKAGNLILYRQRSHPFSQDDLDRLLERGVRTLYISSNDTGNYREYLRESILKNQEIPPVQRYQALREAARAVFSETLSSGDSAAAVAATKDLSQEMVRSVCDSKLILDELLKTMAHDYSGFTHAMNVATYSLLLAQKWGISDEKELLKIGQAALLCDIGMQDIPRHILDKPAKFTARERHIVQQHPTHGFLKLCHREDLTAGQLLMVYGHHERCDGGGYPAGLVRSEIHVYARLSAIVDTYAALTSDRPHRRASRHANVIEYLDRQAGRAFDEEMTRCWIAAIASKK